MRIKVVSVAVVLLFIAGMAQAQDKNTAFLTRDFAGQTVHSVNVQTSGGSIFLTGTTAGTARIEVFVSSSNNKLLSKEALQKRLDENYQLDIGVSQGELHAIARQKKQNMTWKEALNISFKIYTAQQIDTRLNTSGGSITLRDVSGTQNFSTSGGSLDVDNAAGTIRGRTSGGSIIIKDSRDNIDLATSGGSINATDCTGKLYLRTSGGSLTLSNLKGEVEAGTSGGSVQGDLVEGALKAHTSGGNVHLKRISGSLDASTSGGNMSIEMEQLGNFVKLSNSAGNIALQVPDHKGMDLDIHADKIAINPLQNFSGSQDHDHINGSINGGGTLLKVNAGSGRVNVTFK